MKIITVTIAALALTGCREYSAEEREQRLRLAAMLAAQNMATQQQRTQMVPAPTYSRPITCTKLSSTMVHCQ